MKKNIFFLVIITLINYPAAFAQVLEAPDSIKGGYSSCIIVEYNSEYNNVHGLKDSLNIAKFTKAKYNSKGRRLEEQNFIGNKLSDKIIYTYNDDGDILIADTTYRDFGFVYYDKYYFENEKPTFHNRWSGEDSQYPNKSFAEWKWIYDKDGKLTNENYWTYDMSFNYAISYKYNNEGLLSEKIRDDFYSFGFRHTYKYDQNKKLIKLEEYNLKNILLSIDSLVYDTVGNLAETYRFSSEKKLQNIITNKYNSQGKEIEIIRYVAIDPNVPLSLSSGLKKIEFKKVTSYNEVGKLSQESFLSETNEMKYSRKTYNYDNSGNLVELIKYNANNEIASKTVYTFKK